MLQAFTWQQFLVATLILTLVWYAGVFLLFYRRKAKELFTPKPRQPERMKREWEDELEDEPEEESLMGSSREPEGVSSAEMDTLRFAPKAEDPDEYRDTALGIVPDVLEELKSIFHILENEGGTKEDFISLFALVSSKYPKIKGTSNQQALNEHIRENVPFPISDEELDQLWP
ncbi:MAG TPA: hypothetical protein ENO28_04820 [Bacteroidetes bacterium]|nr:hypothetical protein [Bacteroidota bacterium]